ncbi:MAG: hypothetical protein II961_08435 [Candidatus Riflebacteria bacterium]|nr:hypothetical protein [Candidatus Riflebacteria bacterium]
MRRLFSAKFLGIISMVAFLMSGPQLYAQMDDFFGGDDGGAAETESTDAESSTKGKDETQVIEELCKKMCDDDEKLGKASLEFKTGKWSPILENAKKDPFKPIIEKKVDMPPVRPKVEVKQQPRDTKPAPPPIKPIKLFVSGIVGNEGSRLAIVKFENEELTISKDQIVEGKFKVVDIYADRVVVYSNKEQRRHTFKIGGEEK